MSYPQLKQSPLLIRSSDSPIQRDRATKNPMVVAMKNMARHPSFREEDTTVMPVQTLPSSTIPDCVTRIVWVKAVAAAMKKMSDKEARIVNMRRFIVVVVETTPDFTHRRVSFDAEIDRSPPPAR